MKTINTTKTTTSQKTAKKAKKPVIRKRGITEGSTIRPVCAHVRMDKKTSNQLASIVGLCYAHGKRETLAELFESVCLPALAKHVQKYAAAAKKARLGKKVA